MVPADAALVYFCPDLLFLDGEDLLRALPDVICRHRSRGGGS
jgi:hypothetical protein